MDFPTIHTNFWDAVIAVPSVMIITQMIKMLLKVPKKFIPTIALIIGLIISIFISHRVLRWGHIYGMVLWLFSSCYASLKTSVIAFRNSKRRKYAGGM